MIITVDNLSFSYKSTPIFRDVSLRADKGELVAVLGRNGAGKTTLLKAINRVISPQHGSVMIEGVDAKTMGPMAIAQAVGWVPQSTEATAMTVFDLVLLGRKPHFRWAPSKEDYRKSEEAIERIGISHLALRPANELSGGELQLVQIARALAQDPRLILFDEPTSSLDIHNQYRLMATVRAIIDEGERAAIMAVHDLNLALRYCDSFILLKEGRVWAAGDRRVITKETIGMVYDIEVDVMELAGFPIVVPHSTTQ